MDITTQILNSVAIGITILVNSAASYGLFGSESIKTTSDRRKNAFTPYFWVILIIWFVIYGWSITWNVWTYITPSLFTATLTKVPYNWIVEGVLNCAWIFLFTFKYYTYSMWVIILYMTSILATYFMAGVYYYAGQSNEQRFVEFAPISIRLGWLFVATILMFFSTLSVKKTKQKTAVWTCILILLMVNGFWMVYFRDFIVAIPLFVALVGIAIEQYYAREAVNMLPGDEWIRKESTVVNRTVDYEVSLGSDEKESRKDLLDEQNLPSVFFGSVVSALIVLICIVVRIVILYQ